MQGPVNKPFNLTSCRPQMVYELVDELVEIKLGRCFNSLLLYNKLPFLEKLRLNMVACSATLLQQEPRCFNHRLPMQRQLPSQMGISTQHRYGKF